MSWDIEPVAGPHESTAEAPAWDGETLPFGHPPAHRILSTDPEPEGGWVSNRTTLNGHHPTGRCFGGPNMAAPYATTLGRNPLRGRIQRAGRSVFP